MRKFLTFFLTALLAFGVGWAEELTYTMTAKNAGTLAGQPNEVTASLVSGASQLTSGQGAQLLGGSSLTLTLRGFTSSYKLTGITLNYCTNSKKGDGTFTASLGNTPLASYTITAPSSGGGNALRDAVLDITETVFNGSELVLTVSASSNSVYVNKFTVTYETSGGDEPTENLYKKVTSADQIVAGKKYILVAGNYAMGAVVNQSTAPGVEVTIENNTIDIAGTDVAEYVLSEEYFSYGNSWGYNLLLNGQSIGYAGSGKFGMVETPSLIQYYWTLISSSNGYTVRNSDSDYKAYSIRMLTSSHVFAPYKQADSNTIAYLYVQEESEQPVTPPSLSVDQSQLTLKEGGGSFNVTGTNLVDNVGVTQNPEGLFNLTFTGTGAQSWGFERNSNNEVNGTVKLEYQGRELTVTGTIIPGTDPYENAPDEEPDLEAPVTVTYQPDVYLYGDFGGGWGYPEDAQFDYANGVYSQTVSCDNTFFIMFARKADESYNWQDNRYFFSAKKTNYWTDEQGNAVNNWVYNKDECNELELSTSGGQYHCIQLPAGEYKITINAAEKTFSILSSSVNNLTDANKYPTGETFTFNGRVVVTHRQGKNLWIRDVQNRDGSTTAGYIYSASNGADFEPGDVIEAGWTGKRTVYNGLDEFQDVSGLVKDGTADYAPEELTAINPETDINKYVVFKGVDKIVDTEGNVVEQHNQFNYTFTPEEGKIYNVYAIVCYYNKLQYYPISAEDVTPPELTITLESDTKTAVAGETIPVTVNIENAVGDYVATYKIGAGAEQSCQDGDVINITSETPGDVTLTVNVLDGNGAEATATETYSFEAPLASEFVLLTDITKLEDGKQIIIADKNTVTTTSVLSTNQKTNNRGVVNLTVAEGLKITANAQTEIITLKKSGDNWYLKARRTAGYLYAPGGDNYLRTASEITDAQTASISLTEDGDATIEFNTSATQRFLRYNSGSDLFSCYKASSNMKPIYIYVEKPATPEPVDPKLAFDEETPATVYVGDEITLTVNNVPEDAELSFTCDPEGAVTFGENGKATFNTAGEVTITANTTATDEYTAGTATYTITVEARPFLLADEAVELETTVGTPVSDTFDVAGENLKGDITLTLNDTKGVFTIDPTSIAKADAEGTITVTYTPKDEAVDEATITIKSKDAEDVTVTLTGMATLPDPVLTVSTEALEMGTKPTDTFTVTGQHLTENVTLTVTEGTAANFVITPATITPDEDGKVNQEVTVTYKGTSTEDEYATITVKSGTAKKEVIVSAHVLPTPEIIAEPESLTMTAVVGQTPATATFTVMADDLRGDITLTMSETDVFAIEPATIAKADMIEDGVEVTVTYTPTQAGNDNATITIASEAAESVTVTLNGTATVPEVVAAPTFSLVAGSYGEAQQLTISCATEGATILYSTDGGSTWTAGNTVNVDKDMTIMAKAEKDGYTNSATVTAAYIIDIPEELPTITPFKGYYQIKNNGNGMYANIAGRKTLNFTDAPADKAGTVIWLETNDKGQVQSIRSQAADLQGYANRAMRYVPEMVNIVVNKINEMDGIENATGAGSVLGENGLGEIMEAFNEGFDHHLYVEQAQGGWRLYGKTPSMQHVVDFYREHKSQVEAKLPKLEQFINDALDKLINKIGGSTVFTDFSLHQIWEKMGGTLTEPVDEASIMAFYREVLNNKNYVWDFAYQTAQIYWGNVKNHPRYDELKAQLGDYADYIDEFVTQVRPDFKYYVIQRGDEPDYISEGNGEIINNDPRTLWTLEPRTGFTVNIAGEQFGCPYAGGVGGYATTNYTDFAYTVPESVTAYKVASVENGVANLQALSGVIPAQTPVLLMAKDAKDYVLTLSTEAGTAVEDNLLVGPDYLIKTYELKTPMVESLFSLAKGVLGEQLYNQYVAQYEYLQLLYAGTVNNKYFWGLTRDDVMKCLNANGDDCVVRDLSGSKFIDNRQVKTNKAFLVSETDQTITISTLRGDVNHDGYVNIDDVTALIDYLLEVDGRACPYCANVNCDSTVNIVDVTYLIDILLGNISPYAEGGNGN